MTRPLLVLRPEPGAGETCARALAKGFEVAACPLFELRPVAWDCPDPTDFDGLLLTSANAARLAGNALATLKALPAYAVGKATARAARDAGFARVITGPGGIAELIAEIGMRENLHLLHLSGSHITQADYGALKVERRIVYESVALPPTPEILGMLGNGGIALVHSARAGARLAELAPDRAKLALAIISRIVSEAVGDGWQRLAIAAYPRDEALLEAALSLVSL